MTENTVKIKSKRKDSRNILIEAKELGYTLAFNASQLNKIPNDNKALGWFAYSGFPCAIDIKNSKLSTVPSLKDMSKKHLKFYRKTIKVSF